MSNWARSMIWPLSLCREVKLSKHLEERPNSPLRPHGLALKDAGLSSIWTILKKRVSPQTYRSLSPQRLGSLSDRCNLGVGGRRWIWWNISMSVFYSRGLRGISPSHFEYLSEVPSLSVAQYFSIGELLMPSRCLRSGTMPWLTVSSIQGAGRLMVTGGADSCITPYVFEVYVLRAMSIRNDDPNKASRLSTEREMDCDGEDRRLDIWRIRSRKEQRAHIYGSGRWGMTADAYISRIRSNGNPWQAVKDLLKCRNPSGRDWYINPHGTSTLLNDRVETRMLKDFWKTGLPHSISSTKSITGHLMGAAGE